jgi:hypothetical protein
MIDVTVPDWVNPEELSGEVFEFLADDPNNVFPTITSVDSYDYRVRE